MAEALLSREERVAESVYGLLRAGKLSREEYIRRMTDLERTPRGAVAACYCTYLLLRRYRCPESRVHMERMRDKLRAALEAAHSDDLPIDLALGKEWQLGLSLMQLLPQERKRSAPTQVRTTES